MTGMKPAKPTAAVKLRRVAKVPSHAAIVRAVASSTAIETGKSVRQIESLLLSKHLQRRKVALAS
jgi:hypothetical protein